MHRPLTACDVTFASVASTFLPVTGIAPSVALRHHATVFPAAIVIVFREPYSCVVGLLSTA